MGQWESALEDLVNPWKGRRVFLTGHTGFKGTWLALWLVGRGATVRGFALDPATSPSLFSSAAVAQDVDDVRGDIRDYASVEAAMTGFAPEMVFHLAAQPLVRHSYVDPLGTYATNVMGTAHVLEAVRKTPTVAAVVCITTDKVYHNKEWVWPYRETDSLGGFDPYASSKACAELVAAAYRNSFFTPAGRDGSPPAIATARAGNVIGGGDWSQDRLIPDLIRGFQSGQPVLIRNPRAIRPWQHVLDPLQGYLLLAEKLLTGENRFASSFNFGPGDEDAWSVEKIATKASEVWRNGASWTHDDSFNPHESHLLRVDSSRARAELGWKPRLNTEAAVQWTLDWYRACENGANARHQTLAQIDAFQQIAS